MHLLCALLLAAGAAKPLPLPGEGGAFMDYLAFDPAHHAVWVPAGNRGAVYVLDTRTQQFKTVSGFPTKVAGKRTLGPTSAAVAPGKVFVGNRANSRVCAVDAASLKIGACVELPSMPDGLVWVRTTQELWATTPRDSTLTIVGEKLSGGQLDGAEGHDSSAFKVAADITSRFVVRDRIKLDGEPEGYAVDPTKGVFYTNLEDKDRTLAIDAKTRKVLSTWNPGCGEKGPRGVAFDAEDQLLLVACTDGAVALDLAHDGKEVGRVKTGAGVDNVDYSPRLRELFVASGKTGQLSVVSVPKNGALTVKETIPTAEGCRTALLDDGGRAYLPDGKNGRLMVVDSSH